MILKLVPGGSYQLLAGTETYVLDSADWELRPASIDQIMPTVSCCCCCVVLAKQATVQYMCTARDKGSPPVIVHMHSRY